MALKKRLAPAGEDLSHDSTIRQLAVKWLDIAPQERELATQTLRARPTSRTGSLSAASATCDSAS